MRDTNLIDKLKSDFKEYGETCKSIGEGEKMLLIQSNTLDRRNYDPERCKLIQKKLVELYETKIKLEQRWL